MAPPPASDLSAPFLWAQELLDCACTALRDYAPKGCPPRACVYNGGLDVAFDDCCAGQLWVAWGGTRPTITFPDEIRDRIATQCGNASLVLEYEVGIARCAPTLDEQGNPPTCEQIAESALQMHQEAYIILRALMCCLEEWRRAGLQAIWTAQTPAGDEGTCVGSVVRILVGMSACPCLPEPEPAPE